MDFDGFLPDTGGMERDDDRAGAGVRPSRRSRILAAAGTLESFTVGSLARLSGESENSVRYWIDRLERGGEVARVEPERNGTRGRTVNAYRWTPGGRETVLRGIADGLPDGGRGEGASSSGEIDLYEDPFESGLAIAEQWTIAAEEARDEQSVRRNLALAMAEVRSLRSLLDGEQTDHVMRCELLARRLERLSQRPPIEAFRTRIKQAFREALERASAALGGAVQQRVDSERLVEEELALVLNATRQQETTAKVVEEAVGAVGRACYVFEMAQATAARRREALRALGPLFTGPGSAGVKLFVVLDSGERVRSKSVMDDLMSLYGDSSSIGGLMAAHIAAPSPHHGGWSGSLPLMVMAATSMPSDDWLPRGLAKHALLQAWVRDHPATAYEMAKVTLNDPVIIDCFNDPYGRADRRGDTDRWANFSYHQVALNYAAVRGLVQGSFSTDHHPATSGHAAAYE